MVVNIKRVKVQQTKNYLVGHPNAVHEKNMSIKIV